MLSSFSRDRQILFLCSFEVSTGLFYSLVNGEPEITEDITILSKWYAALTMIGRFSWRKRKKCDIGMRR